MKVDRNSVATSLADGELVTDTFVSYVIAQILIKNSKLSNINWSIGVVVLSCWSSRGIVPVTQKLPILWKSYPGS